VGPLRQTLATSALVDKADEVSIAVAQQVPGPVAASDAGCEEEEEG
jgi:hypothetical protein